MKDKSLRKKIEAMKRKRLCAENVVSLAEFRALKSKTDVLTVLVVDDNEMMRNGIKVILGSEGYNVITAADGLELSKVLETSRLDLILLDVSLPWINGLDLCALIKSNIHLKAVPLILISARDTEEDIQKGISAGADDYITKPFNSKTILAAVNEKLLVPISEDH